MSAELAWARLEALAQRLLEHPRDSEPREPLRRHAALLRLWHFPSHGVQTTWTILTPGKKAADGSVPMVREIAWDRPADEARPGEELPTIRVRDAHLPADQVRYWIEEVMKLAVPLVVFNHVVGLDGDYYGLETYETSPFVRVQWWNDGPTEWRHLIDWASGLRRHLQAANA
jgi:hypothetical protein